MAETITHTWQTVEQAAVTMNVSTRTVARRLANGSLESRVDENGRRLVLVQQVHAAPAADTGDDEAADTTDLAPPERDAARSAESSMTVLTVLQSTLTAARQDATAARRSAKWAWAGVGLMAAALLAGTALVSGLLTKATVQRDMLGNQLAETKTELQQTQAQLIATRADQAVTAHDLAGARKTNDELKTTALARPVAPTITAVVPSTRPSLKSRLASIWGE